MYRTFLGRLPATQVLPVHDRPLVFYRMARNQAFDADLDQDALSEARKWYSSFNKDDLPKGHTTYARSSGPGGQKVNKTESKAITVWPVKELERSLPKVMYSGLRSSRYYIKGNDSIMLQAQTHRSKITNADENVSKLVGELNRIYQESVPGMTSIKKMKKYEALEKESNEDRVRSKKQQSAKKSFRKASFE